MDLILDAGGAFQWSRGPSTAPVLSVGARRLTVEPPPALGSTLRPAEDQDEAGAAEPGESPGPGVPDWPIDPAVWAATQFAAAQLGDRRRTTRLVTLASQIARDPGSSLPRQAETWGDLKAAYRLLDRPEATFQAIAAPHWRLTRAQPDRDRLLIIDDTTEIDVTVHGAASAHDSQRPTQGGMSEATGCDRRLASKHDVKKSSTLRPC